MFTDNVNEFNDNFETPLMAATANGASEDDLCLLVKVIFFDYVMRIIYPLT
jgi:hypothetical protein